MSRNNVRYTIKCELCDKEFVALRKDAKTCSDRCRQQRRRISEYPVDWLLHRDHWVYRMFDTSNTLLYVGCTSSPTNRLQSHIKKDKKLWAKEVTLITWMHYSDKVSALEAESRAIHLEKPLYNIVYNKQGV